jgi:hypothetical protein
MKSQYKTQWKVGTSPHSRGGRLDNILAQDDEPGVDQEDYSFQSVFSSLDQIARQWTRIENTGPLIQLVYSSEQLDALVRIEPERRIVMIVHA